MSSFSFLFLLYILASIFCFCFVFFVHFDLKSIWCDEEDNEAYGEWMMVTESAALVYIVRFPGVGIVSPQWALPRINSFLVAAAAFNYHN